MEQESPLQSILQRLGLRPELPPTRAQWEALLSVLHERLQQTGSDTNLGPGQSLLMAGLSHEIRTSLGGVLGMLELLLDTALEPTQREYAQSARQSAEALLAIINDVLDLSKLDAGMFELERVAFDPRAIVEELAVAFAERAHRKGLELNYHVARDVPMRIKGDPMRFRQVLANLLSNAVKFTEEGELGIELEWDEGDAFCCQLRGHVFDTGIGIPENTIRSLFKHFTRGDAATARRYGGTGLGLAIVRRLLHLMDGEIEVHSRVGQGSRFSFSMRADPVEQSRVRLPRSTNAEVLVIEPNELARRHLGSLLASWGVACDLAEDPNTAMDFLEQASYLGIRYNVIFVAFELGIQTGLEWIGRLRQEYKRAIPVVMMTRHGVRIPGELLDQLRITRCLLKPLRAAQIEEVMSLLSRHSPGSMPAMRRLDLVLAYHPNPKVLEEVRQSLERHGVMCECTISVDVFMQNLHRCACRAVIVDEEIRASVQASVPVLTISSKSSGDADVDSVPRHRIRDRLWAVLSNAMHRLPDELASSKQTELPPVRVLFVEDHPINRRIGHTMLVKLGCRVDVAVNGREAIDAWQRGRYDIILLDCELPELDGFQTCARIRSLESPEQHVPIIAVTSHQHEEQRSRAHSSGMDDFVVKPLRFELLKQILVRWGKGVPHAASDSAVSRVCESAILDSLHELSGKHFVNELFRIFLADLPERLITLERAARAEDWPALQRAAHALKGGCQNLGIRTMAKLCALLEQVAGNVDQCRSLLGRLHIESELTATAIEAELAKHEVD
ncbi:MAG: response regulator [Myxococcota bacterium]|nr:response regulator [Myxococcota bacterium]